MGKALKTPPEEETLQGQGGQLYSQPKPLWVP